MILGLSSWFKIHGPPKELITDQETALRESLKCQAYLMAHGVQHLPRGKAQHLGHIDRRGALVRDSIHKIVTQLEIESVKWTSEMIVNEAMFVTNIMLTINGHTPYQAVYGLSLIHI